MTGAWYPDVDEDATPGYEWQPVLVEPSTGVVLTSCDTWFSTRQDCLGWIVEHLVDATLDDE